MGTTTEKTEIFDKPQLYKEGMPLPSTIKKLQCPNCKNLDTICLYINGAGSIIGAYEDAEYFCNQCKKYIVYSYDYDS